MGRNTPTEEQISLSEFNLKRCGRCLRICHADSYAKGPTNWMRLKHYCRNCSTLKMAEWRTANRERSLANAKSWRMRNPEKVRAHWRRYAKENPEKRREHYKRRAKRRSATVEGRLAIRIRTSMNHALIGKRYAHRTFALAGYDVAELKKHLERQFVSGMGWHNMGKWHIDHIIPLSSFKLSGPDDPEVKRAWGLANLRPLWAKENIRKGAKMEFLC